MSRSRAHLPVPIDGELTLPAEGDARPYEVFVQLQRGKPHIHAGTVDAVDAPMALQFAREHFASAGSTVAVTARQAAAIRDAGKALKHIKRGLPVEFIAEDLRLAAAALARVVGRVEVEEVLSEIFSRLCVGK